MLPVKNRFKLPEGVIYLDGNSLGPPPVEGLSRVARVISEQWQGHLISAWNLDGWMQQPVDVASRLGRLIGAPAGTCVLGDTLSIKVHQALSAALQIRPSRRVVLTDSGNFPSDIYMAQGLIAQLGHQHELRVVAPEEIPHALNDDVAVLMLTHVDYKTGRMYDMNDLTRRAHHVGAVMLWDLAHSAGAVDIDVGASECEFAVGCTYKYLNAGPGAPAFIYVHPDQVNTIVPALSGWLGHADPFQFELDYRPGAGIERFRVGTPPVLQIAALEAALDAWDGIDMTDVRAASIALSEVFLDEIETRVPALSLASPRDPCMRGSQVSFHFDDGYAAMQALIERGVVGDFRAPDIMRFGITPLYVDIADILSAVEVIEDVIVNRLWDHAKYQEKSRVT